MRWNWYIVTCCGFPAVSFAEPPPTGLQDRDARGQHASRALTGLKISETADTLTLADNPGKKHSLRKVEIEESKSHTQSTMPDGLEKSPSLKSSSI